jgi:hypothetical protein
MSHRVNVDLVDTDPQKDDGEETDEEIWSDRKGNGLSVAGIEMVDLCVYLDLCVLDLIFRDVGGLRLYVLGFL